MTDDASERDDAPPPPIQFEFDTTFFDQLAVIVPSAPIRSVLLEQGIVRSLRKELARRWRDEEIGILLDDGFGLLFTEVMNPDVPELLVAFDYEPLDHPTLVTLYHVGLAPRVDDLEDDSLDLT